MTTPLLNEDQTRRLASHLRLLADDLHALMLRATAEHPGPAYDGVRGAINAVTGALEALRREFDLPDAFGPSLRRRIAAVADVWAARVEDLRARRMKGYGPVHADLARRLDPHVDVLRHELGLLAAAAGRLGEDA